MKIIKIHPFYAKELQKEFNTSKQTIYLSLRYVFNSDLAKSIRQKAKFYLQAEANKIND